MSEELKKNQNEQEDLENRNDENEGDKAGESKKDDKPKKEKKNFIARGWDWSKNKVKDGVDAVKEHPVLCSVFGALGLGTGAYVTYKVMSTMGADSDAAPVYAPPMIPAAAEEPEEENAEEEKPEVEYVETER